MDINIDIMNPESIKAAILKLQKYKRSLPSKCELLAKKLAEMGASMADSVFSNAVYDLDFDGITRGNPGIVVTVDGPAQVDNKVVYTINADGQNVCFVEFGAGVFYNSITDPYHETRPEGIVGIGEYGLGNGKRNWWAFRMDNLDVYFTHGTPEQPGMYLATKAMRDSLTEIAREVFGND